MDTATSATSLQVQRSPLELLSKEEIIVKYKGLLGIAKKAKQAKDELTEENRQLKEALADKESQKEADKNALMTMKELLDQFTENKLQLTTQLSELQKKRKAEDEELSQLRIENESLQRQMERLAEDNDSLLNDIDRMENQLKQVNLLNKEQKKYFDVLEHEVDKLKEAESINGSLQNQILLTTEENKSLKDKENQLTKELADLKEQYNSIKTANEEQRKKFISLKERFVELLRKLKKLKECKRILLETQHEYSDAVTQWQAEIIKASQLLCLQMQALKEENEDLKGKRNESLSSQDSQIAPTLAKESPTIVTSDITESLLELEYLAKHAFEEYQAKCAYLDHVQEEYKQFKNCYVEKVASEEHQSEFKNLQLELRYLRMQLEAKAEAYNFLHKEKQDLEKQMKENPIEKLTYESERATLLEKLETIECEKIDLLAQLKTAQDLSNAKQAECNELSKQIAKIEDMSVGFETNLKKLEAENQDLQQQMDSKADSMEIELYEYRQSYEALQSQYAQKEREHTDLLGEMRELNEALKARGDVISRQEQKQQEMANELKLAAAKLNQLESEYTAKDQSFQAQSEEVLKQQQAAESKITELELACSRSEQHVKALKEEVKLLNSNEDNQSDVLSTSTISRAEESNRLAELDDTYEEKYNRLRVMALKLKKKLQEQAAYIAEMDKTQPQLQTLKQEIADLRTELDSTKALVESLKAENQKLKTSRKQANVLNLEIEAAEKSLDEATTKLLAKTSELDALQIVVTTNQNTITQLRKEISILESDKAAECAHSKELKDQIDKLNTQVKDAVHSKQQSLSAIKDLEVAQEHLKLDLEELRLQLANSASKNEASLHALQSEKSQLTQQLLETEQALHNSQVSLKTVESFLEDLRVEYLDYKVKAQAVLRKNQSKDTTKERELEEELVAFKATEQQLLAKIEMQERRLEELQNEVEVLQHENATLHRRSQEVLQLTEELRANNEKLADDNRMQIQLQQESLKNQRQQIDSLDALHKAQLSELALSYEQQIAQLKTEQQKTVRLPPIIGAAKAAPPLNSNEQSKIDFLLMEREDAEGSEEAEVLAALAANRKISNASRRSHPATDFMPLDELLNADMDSISDTITTIGATNLGGARAIEYGDTNSNFEPTHLEYQTLREQLQKQESRVRHLTALLAENEQDLAKLTQMNEMLKEELRRQERAVDREKHMTENSEYLKNVVMKFVTLNNSDERMRLVPVLNTILRLSRNETDMLNCVAKGQKVSADSNSRGWTNLLPTWGGKN